MSDLEFPTGAVPAQLAAATKLVPPDLLAEQEEKLAELAEWQYFHFWMEALQNIGIWAEEDRLDDRLPAEFWVRIAQAAHAMEFPEFVPYCLGKAKRLPCQDQGDLVAAFSTLPAVVQVDGVLRSACVEAADLLRAQDPIASGLLAAVDLEGIATHLRAGAYEAIGPEISPLVSEAFDDLFALATSKDFPMEHSRHSWAVISPNSFRVVLSGGLLPLTYAEVWWRAD